MKKIMGCLLFANVLFSQSWELRLDTIPEQNLRRYVYDSKFEEYSDEINRFKMCYPNETTKINDLNVFLNNLKYIQEHRDSDLFKDFEYNGNIIRKVLNENSKNQILTVFLINFMHPKSDNLSSADFIVLVETEKDWNIYNVKKEVKNRFKKRVKRGEFYFNFEHLFNTLKTTTDIDIYCFPGLHYIMITKIYKQSMDDKFITFTSKVNISTSCPEENFFEYILGFKNHLNPEEYR